MGKGEKAREGSDGRGSAFQHTGHCHFTCVCLNLEPLLRLVVSLLFLLLRSTTLLAHAFAKSILKLAQGCDVLVVHLLRRCEL